MGVVGVAVIFACVFFVKSIIALIKYFTWAGKEKAIGEVGDFIKREPYNKAVKYIYSLRIYSSNGVINTNYESVSKNGSPGVNKGDKIELFYDSKTSKFCNKKVLIKELWMNPTICVVSIAIVVLCLVIVTII